MRHARAAPCWGGLCAPLAVKGLELDHYHAEITAWERRFLLPQV
jgi:hypothetical protein